MKERVVVDLGMMADIDEVCAAFRQYDRLPARLGITRLKRAVGRLNRVRLYYGKRIKEADQKGLNR